MEYKTLVKCANCGKEEEVIVPEFDKRQGLVDIFPVGWMVIEVDEICQHSGKHSIGMRFMCTHFLTCFCSIKCANGILTLLKEKTKQNDQLIRRTEEGVIINV